LFNSVMLAINGEGSHYKEKAGQNFERWSNYESNWTITQCWLDYKLTKYFRRLNLLGSFKTNFRGAIWKILGIFVLV
jgi:hypothetical protein